MAQNWMIALLVLLAISGGRSAAGQDAPISNAAASELSASKLAAGGDAWDVVKTLHTISRIEAAGLAGRSESWTELATGRFVDRYTLPPTSGARGFDGKVSWFQDGAGQVRIEDSADARQESANEAYRRSRAIWFPKRHAAELLDGGITEELDHRFRVIRITPDGGRPFEMWLDGTTFLPVRIIETGSKQTQTTELSDYRAIGGIWLPYTLRVTNGDRLFDQRSHLETVEVNVAIPEGSFSPPKLPSRPGRRRVDRPRPNADNNRQAKEPS